MKEISLQQVIYLISSITTEINREKNKLENTAGIPLKVNGKNVVDSEKANEITEILDKIELLQKDLVTLKYSLAKHNIETRVGDLTLTEMLEIVKLKRAYVLSIEYALGKSNLKVETGVGVVQYGSFKEKELKELHDNLEKEILQLSEIIDSVNSKTLVNVELLTK
ncbi:hypothetical protein [Pseudostreptobacillus hongkongensis]|uniref:hypothetical protein n=1 Tax=Pseudostreptobacillus hongkongensis TaxID=1162717 RepID=UPI000830C1F1|nr:hypothetical protein [Pseudostreptobacillus hongkongensis]